MAVQVIRRHEIAPQVPSIGMRTCCYVRVSSLSDEQSGSYSSQTTHFETMIKSDPELVYAGTYGDEGITGTSLEHREGFKAMMKDAEAHKFDQIFTKSISRFGRNVLDSLVSLRRLKELGINVRFFKEGLSTMDGTGELLLLILSSLSQAESQSISENVKMGIRYRFQEGKHFVNCSRFLGYDKVNGQLVINPEQAATVRRIYSLFLNGHSVDMIAAQLTREQVPTGAGKTTWYPTTVRYILSNEKYAGDLRLQKTVVPNFLTHKAKRNTGEADQYYVSNSHEPIIPRDVFDMAQAEAAHRASCRLNSDGKRTGGKRYGSRKALTGRCRCACGAVMTHKRKLWGCSNCGRVIPEARLKGAVMDSFRKLRLEEENLRLLLSRAEDVIASTEPPAPEIIHKQKEGEHMERAEALFQRFQILAILDWLENESSSSSSSSSSGDHTGLGEHTGLGDHTLVDGVGNGEPGDSQCAENDAQKNSRVGDKCGRCYTLEQFIDATRPGRFDCWDDEVVLRFVEGVEVTENGVSVRFKSGVTVVVE